MTHVDEAPALDLDDAYREHRGALLRFILSKGIACTDAEDVLQECFFRAQRAATSFDAARPVWPWLKTIALRLCFDAARANRGKPPPCELVEGPRSSSWYGQPEDEFLAAEHSRTVWVAMRSLPPKDRRLILRRDVEGLRYKEIAAAERMTLDALKSALKRARQSYRHVYTSLGAGEVVSPSPV